MAAFTRGIFIVGAKRTAFGTYGGKLVNKSITDLQEVACKSALTSCNIKPEQVDSVIIGNVINCSSTDGIYLARHVALRCGVPMEKPALTVNRLCGSGFQAVISGAYVMHNTLLYIDITINFFKEIIMGESKIVLTGGTENMSQTPFAVRNIRFGTRLGVDLQLEDVLWAGLSDSHIKTPMGVTAENLAVKYNITRQDSDEFALKSQINWKKAQESGYFDAEITPVEISTKKGKELFTVDEHPKPNTTAEGLAKLPPVFKKNGTVTAGSASGVSDGAASVVIASEEACKEYNLKPLARLMAYTVVGVDPHIMGIGPSPAIKRLLEISGKTLNDIGLIEINEAFAPQTIACQRDLDINPSILNVCGGAIALGHPLGASGSRITSHLVHDLKRQGIKYGIGSACIGGGQGIALLLESL